MVSEVLSCVSYEDIEKVTNGFSEENLIGKFQFGKVYRGIFVEEEVTVKIWEDPIIYKVYPGDNESRLRDEVALLEHETLKSHPNLVKLIGYCREGEKPGIMYGLKSLDTVHNLLCKDGFSWIQRIKVALGFACLLEFLHAWNPPCLPYLVRNIDAAHIMLDQDYNPKLFDFSMISGGILADKRNLINQYVHGCYGYIDPNYALQGRWSEKCDVFAFGVVLLGLITKRVFTEEERVSKAPLVYEWAQSEYKPQKSILGFECYKCSLVHQSLEAGPFFYSSDGPKVTKLAMQCVEYNPQKRPTMKRVVKYLLNLCAVKHHADTLGIDQMLRGNDSDPWKANLSGFWRLMVKKSDFQPTCCMLNGRITMVPPRGIFFRHCEYIQYKSQGREIERHKAENPKLIREGMESDIIKVLSYEDLSLYTDGFSEKNFIGKFQFGKVYHGKIKSQKVTVKIWEDPIIYPVYPGDNECRLRDEIILLQHPNLISHPNLVKLIGYCYEGELLGIVYDLRSLDTLHNLLLKDSLTWLRRIKVAIGFASLLKFLHAQNPPYLPYLVRNISAAHIMIDKDYNPKLFDFGLFSGGILPDRRYDRIQYINGSYGYIDRCSRWLDNWSEKCDVYAFAVVLLGLITKRVYTEEDRMSDAPFVDDWAREEYKPSKPILCFDKSKCSLVHKSLEAEPGFYSSDGPILTKLAVQCVGDRPSKRPTMKQVVKYLLNLRVVQRHADPLGINKMLRGYNINPQEANFSGEQADNEIELQKAYSSRFLGGDRSILVNVRIIIAVTWLVILLLLIHLGL